MKTYNLRGTTVDFPYDAYDVQVTYMDKVMEALQKGQNALLESPTGTGKTLCLLCAALSWLAATKTQILRKQTGQIQEARVNGQGAAEAVKQAASGPVSPTIIYCSRTHTQLQQAAKELKKTSYSGVRATVLGSRAQLCVNQRVKQLSGAAQRLACESEVASSSCSYHKRFDNRSEELAKVADIEDLCQKGAAMHICPFFATRELTSSADLIFMPYSYMVDSSVRKTLDTLSLKGSIIIFDEAHNVESVCSDAASFELTSGQIALSIKEMFAATEAVKKAQASGKTIELPPSVQAPPKAMLTQLELTRKLVFKLESDIQRLSDPGKHPQGNTQPGQVIIDIFAALNITKQSAPMLLGALSLVESLSGSSAGKGKAAPGCAALATALSIVFPDAGVKAGKAGDEAGGAIPQTAAGHAAQRAKEAAVLQSYRAHFHIVRGEAGSVAVATMSFWCMSPGVVMQQLQDLGVRSFLLTSGTLSPMDSYAAELSIAMPIRVENPHVVKPIQVNCSVLTVGPGGHRLNSSYQNRENVNYKEDLGRSIVALARVVPDGMLLFFPSYGVLKSACDAWKASAVWKELEGVKPVIVEPRDAKDFAAAMVQFRRAVATPGTRGALLIAVCQGKVSEGIDFADREGRCVVIAGIPYASARDAKIMCKRAVLDEQMRKAQGTLSGQAWYTQRAMRAVNQALGRVIRHKDDFGAIVLADERFAGAGTRNQVSYWARSMVTVQPTMAGLVTQLRPFFASNQHRSAKLNPGLTLAQPRAVLGRAGAGQVGAQGSSFGMTAPARRAFKAPARIGGDCPAKAGSACCGVSALKSIQEAMVIPSARDVSGLAQMAAAPRAQPLDPQAAAIARQAAVAAARRPKALQPSTVRNSAALSYHSSTSELATRPKPDPQGAPQAGPAQPQATPQQPSAPAARPLHPMFLKGAAAVPVAMGASVTGPAGAHTAAQSHMGPAAAPLVGRMAQVPAAAQVPMAGASAYAAAGGGAAAHHAAGSSAQGDGATTKKASSADFIQKLRRELPPAVFAEVQRALAAYRQAKDVAAFADQIIQALSAPATRALLPSFAPHLPKDKRSWFLNTVQALHRQLPGAQQQRQQPTLRTAPAQAGAAGSPDRRTHSVGAPAQRLAAPKREGPATAAGDPAKRARVADLPGASRPSAQGTGLHAVAGRVPARPGAGAPRQGAASAREGGREGVPAPEAAKCDRCLKTTSGQRTGGACGHAVCGPCWAVAAAMSKGKLIKCPVCGKPMRKTDSL